MNIEQKTARESYIVAHSKRIENYKKSFDAVMNYIMKEINSAANKSEFSVKIKIAPLEKFISSDEFGNILEDVSRILSAGRLVRKSNGLEVDGLGYTVDSSNPTEWIISWDDPMDSPFDISLPIPEEQEDNVPV